MTIRVLITGSREYENRPMIAKALGEVMREHPGQMLTIVHGAARGADRLAGAIARARPDLFIEEQHPVTDWGSKELGTFDRTAGHRRNQRMVDLGATVVLAFPSRSAKNAGTWSCVGKAKVADLEVRVFFDRPAERGV